VKTEILETRGFADADLKPNVPGGKFRLTQKLVVDELKTVKKLPAVWPVPRKSAAWVVDLRDDERELKKPNGEQYTLDGFRRIRSLGEARRAMRRAMPLSVTLRTLQEIQQKQCCAVERS